MDHNFFLAVSNGNVLEVANILSRDSLLVNLRDKDDDMPLHRACTAKKPEMAQLLLKCGALLDTFGCSSRTPLHCAVIERSIECVKVLLHAGARIDEEDSLNENPLHKAAANGDLEIMLLLLNHIQQGTSAKKFARIINHQNVLGSTPLHNSAHVGNGFLIQLLVAVGADASIEDNFGYLPHHIAENRKFNDCAVFLQTIALKQIEAKKAAIAAEQFPFQTSIA